MLNKGIRANTKASRKFKEFWYKRPRFFVKYSCAKKILETVVKVSVKKMNKKLKGLENVAFKYQDAKD